MKFKSWGAAYIRGFMLVSFFYDCMFYLKLNFILNVLLEYTVSIIVKKFWICEIFSALMYRTWLVVLIVTYGFL